MTADPPRVRFVVPADLERRPTGGNHYDRALEDLGVDVELSPVAGTWPDACASAQDLLARACMGRGQTAVAPVVLGEIMRHSGAERSPWSRLGKTARASVVAPGMASIREVHGYPEPAP